MPTAFHYFSFSPVHHFFRSSSDKILAFLPSVRIPNLTIPDLVVQTTFSQSKLRYPLLLYHHPRYCCSQPSTNLIFHSTKPANLVNMAAPDNPIEPPGRNPDAGDQLKSWLRLLAPTKVDLVGDFAGKELFAIHGEALLAHCLHSMKVDFDCVFDPLRALIS